MRKVTEQICEAFKAGAAKRINSTHTDGETLWLHGNAVARKYHGRLEINWCGWVTSTTAERINGVLHAYRSAFRVGRANGAPYAFCAGLKTAMPAQGWQAISDVRLEGSK